MNVLAFDTCFSALSVAVQRETPLGEARVFAEREVMETGHAEALMPMIQRVMSKAGIGFAELDAIVVTRGPGTFTGVRTGVAAGRALALATGARLVGVSSLWAIGAAAMTSLPQLDAATGGVLVVMDARKGEVYAQVLDAGSVAISDPMLIGVEEAAEMGRKRRLVVVGNAADLVKTTILPNGAQLDDSVLDEAVLPGHHHGESVALLRAARQGGSAGGLQPLYLRPADAKPQAGKSLPWVTS